MPALQRAWRRLLAALGLVGSPRESERRLAAQARAAERERIAADFHDGPLQGVIALRMRLECASSLAERDPAAALRELGELTRLAGAVAAELRDFLRSMGPPPVETCDLSSLAVRVVEDFRKDTAIQVRFRGPDLPVSAAPETCLELAQILREALANVRKHAGAERVEVALAESAGVAELLIEDDGAGFPFSGTLVLEELERQGLGPASIRKRVRNTGGELTLESRPGQGSRLLIRIPV